MLRFLVGLFAVLTIVLCASASSAVLGADSICNLTTLTDNSPVTILGIVSEIDLGPSESDVKKWANFDLMGDDCSVHIYWKFTSSGIPLWFSAGSRVSVSGTYDVDNLMHRGSEVVASEITQAAFTYGDTSPNNAATNSKVRITPWGAAGEVQGSCYQVEFAGDSILVDCGSFMNSDDDTPGDEKRSHRDTDPFNFNPRDIDALLVTHVHQDHIGRISRLVSDGFRGKIYMTEASKELFRLTLRDWLLSRIEERIEAVKYGEDIPITDKINARFVNAGHIPGSASIVLTFRDQDTHQTVVFSGDIGSGHHPFLNSPDLESLSKSGAQTLIIESTYGDDSQAPDDPQKALDIFIADLSTAVKSGQRIVIPAFALDRTQRILAVINEAQRSGELRPDLKVAVGGKSSCDLTVAYVSLQKSQETFNSYFSPTFWESKPLARVFWSWSYLRGENCKGRDDRTDNEYNAYDVIVTPSGSGSSSLANTLLAQFVSDPKHTFVKVGWSPESSPMGQLGECKAGEWTAREPKPRHIEIEIRNAKKSTLNVEAKCIDARSVFSGHAHQKMLLEYVEAFSKLKRVIISHGDDPKRDALEKAIRRDLAEKYPALEIKKPGYGEIVEIAVSPTTPAPKPESKSNLTTYVAIGLGVLLSVAIVVVVLRRR